MSNFTPTVDLYYIDGSNPKHYGLTTILNPAEGSIINSSNVQEHPDDENSFFVVIELSSDPEAGTSEHDSDLGELTLLPSVGFIDVHFEHDGQLIEKKKVRTEEAQKESRPIGKIQ